jgi:hypothetical protein
MELQRVGIRVVRTQLEDAIHLSFCYWCCFRKLDSAVSGTCWRLQGRFLIPFVKGCSESARRGAGSARSVSELSFGTM